MFYQITLNHNQIYVPGVCHDAVIKDRFVDAWWHYIPNVWLIKSTESAQYHTNRILQMLPGVPFLIVKVDLNEYNGYLPQAAWDWIREHSEPKPTYKELPKSTILDAILKNASLPPLPSPTPRGLPPIEDLFKKK